MKRQRMVVACLFWVLPVCAAVRPINLTSTVLPVIDIPQIVYVPQIIDIPEIVDIPEIIDVPGFVDIPDFIDIPEIVDIPDIVYVPPIVGGPTIVDLPFFEPVTIIDPVQFIDVVTMFEPIRIITIPNPVAAPIEVLNVPDVPDIDIAERIDLTVYSTIHIYKAPDIPQPVEVSCLATDAYLTGRAISVPTVDLIAYTKIVPPFRMITIPNLYESPVPVDLIEVTKIVDTSQIEEVIELLKTVDRVKTIIDTADHVADLIGLMGYPFEPLYHPDSVEIVEWAYRVAIIDTVAPPILVEWPHVWATDLRLPLYVDAVKGDDQTASYGTSHPFATIQKAIDSAVDNDTIRILPGVYREAIDFGGKPITVCSAGDAAVLEAPDDFAVSFCNGEDERSILRNLVVRNSLVGVFVGHGSPAIANVTVVGNQYGIECSRQADPQVRDSILWDNAESDLYGCQAVYSCVQRPVEGEGNLSEDPLFVDAAHGDYHLRSERGRYWPTFDIWVLDEVSSPCIDAADPDADSSLERKPNGGRRNMGAYGGTAHASMSEAPVSTCQ